jgi:hypothetical protein
VPSAQARLLTRSHRRELGLVAGLVSRRVRVVAARAVVADIDAWWDGQATSVERIVTAGHDAAATLGARYLRRHAAVEGVAVEPIRAAANLTEIGTSLRVTGPIAFKKHLELSGSEAAALRVMGDRLAGSAERLALLGERSTVMDTFAESDQLVGHRRVTSGDPCAFCAMLASRGAVYSKRTVDFQAHDSCRCTPEPLYQRESEPKSVVALRDQWEQATAGLSGVDALNAFRRARSA